MGSHENKRLKILFIIGSLGTGGAEKQLIYILESLKIIGADTYLIALASEGYYEPAIRKETHQINLIGNLNPPLRIATILKTVREFQPHFIQATHFFASFYAGITGRLTGIPSIGAIRNDFFHDRDGVGKRAKWIIPLPDAFIANSYNARENFLSQGYSPSRIHVIQNVINLKEFDTQLPSPLPVINEQDYHPVITVARLVPAKRLERFISALASARKVVPQLEGLIVGSGPEENRLRSHAENLGLGKDGLRFLGERHDIPSLLAQASIFVLTSDREGFPNVILEAMAASLPVLSTPAGEAKTLIQNGVNGFLLPYDDPEILAGRLVELSRSPEKRQMMGTVGRNIVERQYSFEKLTSELFSVYRQIANTTKNKKAIQAVESMNTSRHI